jgi:predicted dehydrogenase
VTPNLMTECVHAILIGAGQRGAEAFATYALQNPHRLRFVAVAEPDPTRRAAFADQHQIPPENRFESWEPLLAKPAMGTAALVCTQDRAHTAPALAALQAGYHVLLEKPMAPTAGECRALVDQAARCGRQLHVAHVLRYTKHFQRMREILRSGVLGEIVNVSHRENVSWWHMAHSYVRGNWANSAQSTPMILAKCCHDFDILIWMLARQCRRLSSFGSLAHFRPDKAPPGVPDYCLDGCPVQDTCPYYAPFIYVDLLPLWRSFADTAASLPALLARAQERAPGLVKMLSYMAPPLRQVVDYGGWPRSVVAQPATPENLLEALKKGPYGRCVYRCANDAVDNQVVAMQFEGDLSVTLTMQGHSHIEGRTTRIEGSRGSLMAHFGVGGAWIEVNEHRSDCRMAYDTSAALGEGHGGGDQALLASFLDSVSGDGKGALSLAEQALESHLLAFAAETARLAGRVVDMEGFRLTC